jgi:hypothetical protein
MRRNQQQTDGTPSRQQHDCQPGRALHASPALWRSTHHTHYATTPHTVPLLLLLLSLLPSLLLLLLVLLQIPAQNVHVVDHPQLQVSRQWLSLGYHVPARYSVEKHTMQTKAKQEHCSCYTLSS